MKKYDKYKNSGIEWIGEIPESWNVKKIKHSIDLIMGQSPNSEDCNSLGNGIPFLQGNADFNLIYPMPQSWCEKPTKIAPFNSVLLSVRAPIGAVNMANSDYCIGRGLCALISNNPKFWYYHSICLHDELNSLGTGSTFKAISTEQILNTFVVIPPEVEQTAITNYLDRKTAEIDALIADKKRLLELYEEEKNAIINQAVTKGINPDVKMKDSGIEWLGKIPEHWKIRRIKSISSYFKGFAFKSSDFELNGIPIVKASNIKKWQIVDITSFIAENNQRPEFEKVRLKKGDAILSTVGSKPNVINSAVGQIATVSEEFNNSYLNQNTLCIRPNEQVNDLFLKYTFLSKYFRSNLDSISAWIANQAYLEVEDILSIQIILPLFDEQKDISIFLDAECARIDAKKSRTEKLIDLLTEYRTALISEVVTGKIKVTD